MIRLLLLAAAIAAGSKLPDIRVQTPGAREQRRLSDALKSHDSPALIVPRTARDTWRSRKLELPVLIDVRNALGGSALVDSDGVVRRFWNQATPELITAEVKAWLAGRAIYDAQCARCHGADGSDLGYAGIKSLAGLGRRHDDKRIIELTEATGVVDLSSLTAADKKALALYVSGL